MATPITKPPAKPYLRCSARRSALTRSMPIDMAFRPACMAPAAAIEEVRRIAKRYFVQTPYKYFPLEPHSFLPFLVVLLPRRWQVRLLDFAGRYWIKAVKPDFRLLTIKDMQALFHDAEIEPGAGQESHSCVHALTRTLRVEHCTGSYNRLGIVANHFGNYPDGIGHRHG